MENKRIVTYELPGLKERALRPLTDELTTRAFMLTSALVSRIGDPTAASLLAHTSRYFDAYIAPFFEQGYTLNMQFEGILFEMWMQNKRAGPEGRPEGVGQTGGLTMAVCHFAWKVETALWGAGAVCLKGLGPNGRDKVYLGVLRIFEVRWKVHDSMLQLLKDMGCGQYADGVLSERWCRALLPDEEEAAAAAHRMMGPAGKGQEPVGESPCILECRCDDEKVAVYLDPLRAAPAPWAQSGGGVQQGAVFMVHGVVRR